MGIHIFSGDYVWIKRDDGAKSLARYGSSLPVPSFLGSRKKKNSYKAQVAEKYKFNVKRIINSNRNEYIV